MSKKLLALALALILCLGCLSGCGTQQDAQSGTDESASAVESAPENTPEPTAPDTAEPGSDAEDPAAPEVSAEISLPLTTEDVEITVWYPGAPPQMPYLDNGTYTNTAANRAMSEATGIDIVFNTVSNEAAVDTFNLMIASNDLPDIIDSFTNFYTLGMDYAVNEEEIIYDLAPYLSEQVPNYYKLIEENPDVKRDITTDTGIIGGVYVLSSGTSYNAQGLGIRKDLLDAVGADIPVTYDEFEQTAKAIYDQTGVQGALIYKNFFGQYFAGGFGTFAKFTTAPDLNYPFYQVDGAVKFAHRGIPGIHDQNAELVSGRNHLQGLLHLQQSRRPGGHHPGR